jgi:signal transduction histidine kinase
VLIQTKYIFLISFALIVGEIRAEKSFDAKRDSLIARVDSELSQKPIDTLIGQYRINDLMAFEVTSGSYEKADSIFEAYNDFSVDDSILLFLYEMALGNYIDNGKTEKTLELATSILHRFPENHMAKSKAYIALGQTAYIKGQFEQTIPYIKLAIQEAELTGNQLTIDGSRMNLGLVYLELGQVDSARIILKKLLIKKGNSFQTKWRNRCLAAMNIGKMYLDLNLDSAEYYYKIAIEAAKEGDKHKESFIAEGAVGLGTVYIRKKEYPRAYKQLKFAEKNYKTEDGVKGLANVFRLLSVIESNQGDIEKAFEYLNLSKSYADSLTKLASNKSLMEAQAKFDVASKELQNEVLKKEKEQADTELALQRNLMIFIGLLFFLALFFILQLVSRKKAIQRLNSDLRKKKNHLAELINEKDNLMQVLIHDVRSPLASISGVANLLFIQDKGINKESYELISEMNRISNVGLEMINSIWNAYLVESDDNEIEFDKFNVVDSINDRIQEYLGKSESRNIELVYIGVKEVIIVSNEEYFSIILRNLISNALKFSEKNTKIEFHLALKEKFVVLRIKDQGPGFSEKDQDEMFQKFKRLSAKPLHNEKSSGIGLYLVNMACKKLRIKISLNSTYTDGAEFILKIPRERV